MEISESTVSISVAFKGSEIVQPVREQNAASVCAVKCKIHPFLWPAALADLLHQHPGLVECHIWLVNLLLG